MFYLVHLFIALSLLFSAAVSAEPCGNHEEARKLAKLIMEDDFQNRNEIRCNQILSDVAAQKAKDMAEFGMVTHNLKGSPNGRLEEAGFKLPHYYGRNFNSNQVEAIAGGYTDAEDVWDAFKKSTGHRMHLLGEHEFYVEQDEIGIGFYREWETPHVEYWVVFLTKGASKNQSKIPKYKSIPNKTNLMMVEGEEEKN